MSTGGRRLRRSTATVTVLAALVGLVGVPAVAWGAFGASVSPATPMTVSTFKLLPPANLLQATCSRSGNTLTIGLTWTAAHRATAYSVVLNVGGAVTTTSSATTSHTVIVDKTKTSTVSITSTRGTWVSSAASTLTLTSC